MLNATTYSIKQLVQLAILSQQNYKLGRTIGSCPHQAGPSPLSILCPLSLGMSMLPKRKGLPTLLTINNGNFVQNSILSFGVERKKSPDDPPGAVGR